MSSQSTTRRNRATVLAAVRERGDASRAEIADRTGLSVATVSRAAAALIDAELLVEQSAVGPAGGRPLGRLRVHDGAATVLAVDVADRHTTLALVDLGGGVVWREHLGDAPAEPARRLEHTLAAIDRAWTAPAGRGPVAIGVAIPGPVQSDGMIDFAPALQWHAVALGDMLRDRIAAPIVVANDANLIAVAESRWGSARDAQSLVALAVFDGVGAGIVDAGRLLEGSRGFAGQVGRMLLTTGTIDRVDVDFGELETHLGAVGLRRRAHAAGIELGDGEPFSRLLSSVDGDDAAAALARTVLDEFAVALGNVCALLDPEVIVLAGRFAPLADLVAPQLERRLTGRVLHIPRLVPASTSDDGALLGAAAVAIDAFGPLEQLIAG